MDILKKTYTHLLICGIALLLCQACKPEPGVAFRRFVYIYNFCDYNVHYSVKLQLDDPMNQDIGSENTTAEFILNVAVPKGKSPFRLGEVSERLLPARTVDAFVLPRQFLDSLIIQKNPPFKFSGMTKLTIKHDAIQPFIQEIANVDLQKMEYNRITAYRNERYLSIDICPVNIDNLRSKQMQRSTVPY